MTPFNVFNCFYCSSSTKGQTAPHKRVESQANFGHFELIQHSKIISKDLYNNALIRSVISMIISYSFLTSWDDVTSFRTFQAQESFLTWSSANKLSLVQVQKVVLDL